MSVYDEDAAGWPSPLCLENPQRVDGDGLTVFYDVARDEDWLKLAGGRFYLPKEFHAFVDKPELPKCQLAIRVTPTGPACVRLTLVSSDEQPLTATRIRIPLGELVEEATVLAASHGEARYDPQEFLSSLTAAMTPAPGKLLPRERLEEAADVYRYALRLGQPPTNAVAEALNVSRSTAGRYVVRARRAGLLGPAVPGRAGEEQPPAGEEKDVG